MHVIKENVHPVESLQRRKNKKWRKFESSVELVQGERNLKDIGIGLSLSISWIDREKKRNMLFNETRSGASAQA